MIRICDNENRFVNGNVDPSFFDDSFSFQDPDVKIKGIKSIDIFTVQSRVYNLCFTSGY